MSTLPPSDPFDQPANPYAAPTAQGGYVLPDLPGLSAMRFTIGEVFDRAWRIYKDQMGLCIGVVLAAMGLNFVTSQLLQIIIVIIGSNGRSPLLLGLVFLIAMPCMFLFQMWLNIGLGLFMLNLAAGRKAAFGDLFAGGPFLIPTVLASILYVFILTAVVALGSLPLVLAFTLARGDQAAVFGALVIGGLLATIIVVIASLRLSQFYYLIIDRRAGALDSFQRSIEITRGNALQLFLLGFLSMLLVFAGVLACLVGAFFTAPLVYVVFAVAYLTMSGQPVADPAVPRGLPELKPLTLDDPLA